MSISPKFTINKYLKGELICKSKPLLQFKPFTARCQQRPVRERPHVHGCQTPVFILCGQSDSALGDHQQRTHMLVPAFRQHCGHIWPLLLLCRERSPGQLLCLSVYPQLIASDSLGDPRDHLHRVRIDRPPGSWIQPCFMAGGFVMHQVHCAASHCKNEPDNYLFLHLRSPIETLTTSFSPLAVELVQMPGRWSTNMETIPRQGWTLL